MATEETVPEAFAETVPEAIAETVPEAIAETVPEAIAEKADDAPCVYCDAGICERSGRMHLEGSILAMCRSINTMSGEKRVWVESKEHLQSIRKKINENFDQHINRLEQRRKILLSELDDPEKIVDQQLTVYESAFRPSETLLESAKRAAKCELSEKELLKLREQGTNQLESLAELKLGAQKPPGRRAYDCDDDELTTAIYQHGKVINVAYSERNCVVMSLDGRRGLGRFEWRVNGVANCPVTGNVVIVMRQVHIYKPDGTFVRWLDVNALCVTVDSDGRIIVVGADYSVPIYNQQGELLNEFSLQGSGEGQVTTYMNPSAVACDEDNNIYVLNPSHVLVFRPDGTFSRVIGEGELSSPVGLTVNARSQILTINSSDHTLRVFDREGKQVKRIQCYVVRSRAIATDREGYVLVACRVQNANHYNSSLCEIRVFGPQGDYKYTIADSSKPCRDITGIALLEDGRIAVADAELRGVLFF